MTGGLYRGYNMGQVTMWAVFVASVTIVGIVQGQGTCYICPKDNDPESCKQSFYPSYDINEELCVSLAKDKSLEKTVCRDFPKGYQTFCVQAVTEFEFTCRVDCPPPPVINEKFYGGMAAPLSANAVLLSVTTGAIVFLTSGVWRHSWWEIY